MEGEKTDDDQLSFLFLNSYGIKKLKFRITRSHIGEKTEFHAAKYNKLGWIGVLNISRSIEWYKWMI